MSFKQKQFSVVPRFTSDTPFLETLTCSFILDVCNVTSLYVAVFFFSTIQQII